MTDQHVAELAASYAFGALNQDERRRVELHLADCETCATAIAGAQHFAAHLAYVVTPYRAPVDLKETLEQHVRGEALLARADLDPASEPTMRSETPVEVVTPDATSRHGLSLQRLVLVSIPWTMAVVGWLVASAFLIFSHGQADRIATAGLDTQAQLRALTAQLDDARVIRDFMLTPGVKAAPLIYQAGTAHHTNVTLFYAPGYIHAVIAARGLAQLPSNKVYCVWARSPASGYVFLGTLSTSGIRSEGVAILVAPHTLDSYGAVGVSIEHTPAPRQPVNSLIFLLKGRAAPSS